MDSTTDTQEALIQAEVSAWIDRNWDPDVTVATWWGRVASAGYSAPKLPAECGGRGWSPRLASVAAAQFAAKGVLGPPGGVGIGLAAPTLAAHGSIDQRERLLPPILDGREAWCQLFSEPGAGSDLAALRTAARKVNGGWRISGQKVWTSAGQFADRGMLLARTDPGRPKHKGITWFVASMHQEGVDVRPMREMTGRAGFNEVFLDEVWVPDEDVVGEVNDGWRIANTTLGQERSSIGAAGGSSESAAVVLPGSIAGNLATRAGDLLKLPAEMGAVRIDAGTVERLAADAVARGRLTPVVRHAIVDLWATIELSRLLALRGRSVDGVANLAKVSMARRFTKAQGVAALVEGASTMLADSSACEVALFAPAPRIYGGTDEIQLNIIAERALGLPREVLPPNDTPFRDLPK